MAVYTSCMATLHASHVEQPWAAADDDGVQHLSMHLVVHIDALSLQRTVEADEMSIALLAGSAPADAGQCSRQGCKLA